MNLLDLIANGGADLANTLGVSMDTPDVTDAAKKLSTYRQDSNGLISPYAKLYAAAGTKYGVPPWLLERMGWAESHWNPNAQHAGDYGIAQFNAPSGTMQKYGLNKQTAMNPTLAIDAQARYMRDLLASNNSDMLKAVEAYNAGQGNVNKGHINGITQQYASEILPEISPYGRPINMPPWGYHPGDVTGNNGGVPPQYPPGNQVGKVGGGFLPPPRNIGGQGPMTGINGVIQGIVKPPVQDVANTLAGNDTDINRAVGAPFKQGVDNVNSLADSAVNSAMDTFKGQPTWPNNMLSGLIGGQIQGINNSLSNAITPPVQSGLKGLQSGLSGLANTLSQGDQQARQMAQQALQTNSQAAQAARQKAAQVASVAANAISTPAQAQAMPAGAAPQGAPGAGINMQQPQPQQAGQAAPDGPLSDAESSQYLAMPLDKNAPPPALAGPMTQGQLPKLQNSQQGAMAKFGNFLAGAQHEIGDKVSGIEQLSQQFQGNNDQAQKIAADRARQNDAFQISTGQQPGVDLLNPSQNPGGWAADVGMGGPLIAGAGQLAAPLVGMAIRNPMKTLGYGYAATHLNSMQGLLHLLGQLGVGGGG